MRTTGVISPAFIPSISFLKSADSSLAFSGPISPPLAFDGASDTSAATFANGLAGCHARANLLGLRLRRLVSPPR